MSLAPHFHLFHKLERTHVPRCPCCHQCCHRRFAPSLLSTLLFLTTTPVQDCQAVSVEGGNLTLERREEIFEKFYGCYFAKYFHNSKPPIPLQQFVQQSVEAAIGSDEKVKKKKGSQHSPGKFSQKLQVPSSPCVSWICHPSLHLLRTPVHGFQVFILQIF